MIFCSPSGTFNPGESRSTRLMFLCREGRGEGKKGGRDEKTQLHVMETQCGKQGERKEQCRNVTQLYHLPPKIWRSLAPKNEKNHWDQLFGGLGLAFRVVSLSGRSEARFVGLHPWAASGWGILPLQSSVWIVHRSWICWMFSRTKLTWRQESTSDFEDIQTVPRAKTSRQKS